MSKVVSPDAQEAFGRLKLFVEKAHGHGLIATEEELQESQADLETVGNALGYEEETGDDDKPQPARPRKSAAKK